MIKELITNIENYYENKYNSNLTVKCIHETDDYVWFLIHILDIDYIVEEIYTYNISNKYLENYIKIRIDSTIEKMLKDYISN